MKQVQTLSSRERVEVYEYLYHMCTIEGCECPFHSGVGKAALLGLGIAPVDYRIPCPLSKQCMEVRPNDWRDFVELEPEEAKE